MTTADLIGRRVSFDRPNTSPALRLVGTCTAAKPLPPTQRGAIPDFEVTVQGSSGAILTVSFVESYMSLMDDTPNP